MKRRRFFGLLGAVAAAPAVVKASTSERIRFNRDADAVHVGEPVAWGADFDESDYVFPQKPTGLVSPKALQLGHVVATDPEWPPSERIAYIEALRITYIEALREENIITPVQAKELLDLP